MSDIPRSDHPPVSEEDLHTVSALVALHNLGVSLRDKIGSFYYTSHPEGLPENVISCLKMVSNRTVQQWLIYNYTSPPKCSNWKISFEK